jgi:hypothetical protein
MYSSSGSYGGGKGSADFLPNYQEASAFLLSSEEAVQHKLQRSSNDRRRRLWLGGTIVVGGVAGVLLLVYMLSSTPSTGMTVLTSGSGSGWVDVRNDAYGSGRTDIEAINDGTYPFDAIVEPFQQSTFTVVSADAEEASSYHWKIFRVEDDGQCWRSLPLPCCVC